MFSNFKTSQAQKPIKTRLLGLLTSKDQGTRIRFITQNSTNIKPATYVTVVLRCCMIPKRQEAGTGDMAQSPVLATQPMASEHQFPDPHERCMYVPKGEER